jgi:hypothetical protein
VVVNEARRAQWFEAVQAESSKALNEGSKVGVFAKARSMWREASDTVLGEVSTRATLGERSTKSLGERSTKSLREASTTRQSMARSGAAKRGVPRQCVPQQDAAQQRRSSTSCDGPPVAPSRRMSRERRVASATEVSSAAALPAGVPIMRDTAPRLPASSDPMFV